jgi:hypothetical protein
MDTGCEGFLERRVEDGPGHQYSHFDTTFPEQRSVYGGAGKCYGTRQVTNAVHAGAAKKIFQRLLACSRLFPGGELGAK